MFERAMFAAQKVLVFLGYWAGLVTFARRRSPRISWVIGPRETAGILHAMASRVPDSYSVSLLGHPFYAHDYDLSFPPTGRRRSLARASFRGPLLLGWLANRASGFVYIGAYGFLFDQIDGRRFEFAFLKRRGIRIACYWCGSDIRSTKRMHELEKEMGVPNISTYFEYVQPFFATEQHERLQQRRAAAADKYADVMFTFPTAQRSYLTRWAEPAFYFVENDLFTDDRSKFDDLDHIVVAHSSSSPIIKGTQLVRSAVGALWAEGYEFEYLELIEVLNAEVLAALSRAHIVMNHFYGFTVGVFALEAMGAHCAILSSTDATIETMLPPGANDAVMVTKYNEVYLNLKALLDQPKLIRPLADRGHDWALRYTSAANAGHLLTSVLDAVLDGTYDEHARAKLSVEELWGDPKPAAG